MKIVAWKGRCEVHERFTKDDILSLRAANPGLVVLALRRYRPAPWAWAAMGVCLLWPPANEKLLAGNPRHAVQITIRTGIKNDGTMTAHHSVSGETIGTISMG